jgi:cystathionine gamma-lyase
VVMGALLLNDKTLYDQLYFILNSCGANPGPMDSFLVLRGLKTLHIRMERHCFNGRKIAEYLKTHPKIEKIYWPGFTDHPNHEIAKKQMRDFGGMISIVLKNADLKETFRIASSFNVFSLAESLGGVESLINHPATMTHASIPKEERERVGVVDNLLRLSVGIENVEDLLEDLKQALS